MDVREGKDSISRHQPRRRNGTLSLTSAYTLSGCRFFFAQEPKLRLTWVQSVLESLLPLDENNGDVVPVALKELRILLYIHLHQLKRHALL